MAVAGPHSTGNVTLLVGLPDVGKSHIFIDICARHTTGRSLPPEPEQQGAYPESVLIICTEDEVEYTLVPRLMAAGADMNRVHFLRYLVADNGERRGLDLTQDVMKIAAELQQNPDITLVVFDPISEFLGTKIDGHSNTAVRAVLGQLMDLLDSRDVAALGVSHVPKVKAGSVQTASIGSIGFSATARSSLLVVNEEEPVLDDNGEPTGESEPTGRKLLTVNKGNLAAPEDRQTLALKLVPRMLDPPFEDITMACVKWDSVKNMTRNKWQQQSAEPKKPTEKFEAKTFIKQAMSDPEQPGKYGNRLSSGNRGGSRKLRHHGEDT